MKKTVSPEGILRDMDSKKTSREEALKSLESLINESIDDTLRSRSIEAIGNIQDSSEKVYNLLEHSLISDESPIVRFSAAKVLIQTFDFHDERNPVIWAIENERSIYFFKKLLDLLEGKPSNRFTTIRTKSIDKISRFYNLNPDDSRFILDVDFIDYLKFRQEFKVFIEKFQIKEDHKLELIRENTELGLKGLGRIANSKDGYITELSLKNIERIPNPISKLQKLKKLEICHCKLKNFPISSQNLYQLDHLVLNNNELEDIPDWAVFVASKMNNIRKYIRVGVDPEEAKTLSLLEVLTGQALIEIKKKDSFHPSLLFHYRKNDQGHLIGINISSELNQIGIIPKQLCSLKYLEELNLSHQNISSVPLDMQNLRNLKILRLNDNNINVFPDFLLTLDNLELIDLSNNKFDAIPKDIDNYPYLII